MKNLVPYFARYDRILVFDTETTGLWPDKDEIIQFSSVTLEAPGGVPAITDSYNTLITLEPGRSVPPEITRLTGISDADLQSRGISRQQAAREIGSRLEGNTLLCAYNAQFDLTFLFFLLRRYGDPRVLQGKDKLDLLTVYRDRRAYPHKLCSAITAYNLDGVVQNSHSADDDALAAAWIMDAMAAERDDLMEYINIFGYIPKYGPPKQAIRSVTYLPQPFEPGEAIYRRLAQQAAPRR